MRLNLRFLFPSFLFPWSLSFFLDLTFLVESVFSFFFLDRYRFSWIVLFFLNESVFSVLFSWVLLFSWSKTCFLSFFLDIFLSYIPPSGKTYSLANTSSITARKNVWSECFGVLHPKANDLRSCESFQALIVSVQVSCVLFWDKLWTYHEPYVPLYELF